MIRGIVGLPGQGKTIAMARWAEMDKARGIPVAANFRLRGADYVPKFEAVLRWCSNHPNGSLYIDEAGVVLNARNWALIPFEVQALFAQHRHFGLDLCWGAQRLKQVDKSLSEVSQYISQVKKVFPGLPPAPVDGEYQLVPVFRMVTFEVPDLKRKAWDEYHFYSSRWGKAFDVSSIKGLDDSSAEGLEKAMAEWERRKVDTSKLRLR